MHRCANWGHSRYARFGVRDVAGIPAAMVGVENPYTVVEEEVDVRPTEAGGGRGHGAGSSGDPLPAVPPGWTYEASDRVVPPPQFAHAGPAGSTAQAWAVHRQLLQLGGSAAVTATRTRHGA